MKLEQEISPKVWLHLSDAKFLVCARDANNKGSALMNPLEIVTDDEKAIFELGESKFIILKHLFYFLIFLLIFVLKIKKFISNTNKKKENKIIRQNEAQVSLFNVPPNNMESLLIHEMFKKTLDLK